MDIYARSESDRYGAMRPYIMREEPIEANRVLMTLLAELEGDILHMNVGSLFG